MQQHIWACTVLQLTLILHYIIEWSPRFCNPKPGSVSMLVDKKQFISVLVKVVTTYLCWQSHAVIPIMLMRLE
jgi:hypothetical protein